MSFKPVMFFACAALVASLPYAPAEAGNYGGHSGGVPGGPSCNTGVSIFKPVNINKTININKNIDNSKNINVFKPVNINKNIDINKNVVINKNVNINKNINDNKNININKNIIINKGGGSAEASAIAEAFAQAMASASANASVTVNNNVGAGANAGASAGVVYYSNSYSDMKIVNKGGEMSAVNVEQRCVEQYASVVKAIHAVCIAANGEEFPASHMVPDTWINASYEGEIARCIPGAHIRVTVGDVLQSDQGMAGTYRNGTVIECGAHEALRHYKNGMLKCAPAVPVPDCTERTNLRRYGTGDLFFTFRAQVCVAPGGQRQDVSLSMSLDGGVGDQ